MYVLDTSEQLSIQVDCVAVSRKLRSQLLLDLVDDRIELLPVETDPCGSLLYLFRAQESGKGACDPIQGAGCGGVANPC